MSDTRRVEQKTREWLELGPARAPDAPVQAALLAVQEMPQERDFGFWPRPSRGWVPLRLAMVAAIVAVALIGFGQLGLPAGTMEGGPSPSVTASPSPTLLDTTSWLTFTSDRYGASFLHPADWAVTPASEFWDLEIESNFVRARLAWDALGAPSNNPEVDLFSMRLLPGTSEDAFLAQYFEASWLSVCLPPRKEWAAITIDRSPALLVASTCEPYAAAFAFIDGRAYGFRLLDRAQYPDGPLFRTILSTVRFSPGNALEAPSPAPSASPRSSSSLPAP